MRVNLKKTVLLSLGSFLFLGLQQITDWFVVRFAGIRGLPFFIDLGAVLKSSDCEKVYGWGIYDPSIADGCSYIYGSSLIRIFQFFHLNQDSSYIGGWVLLGLFSVFIGTTIAQSNLRNQKQLFLLIFVLFSPPTMLLLERANIDILIVLLMAIFSYALTTNRYMLAYLTLFIASVSKFYPVPLFGWLALTQRNVTRRLLSIAFFLIACSLIITDISKMAGGFPRNAWASFGNPVFGIYFHKIGYDLPNRVQDLLGIVLLLITYLILNFAKRLKLINLPKIDLNLGSNSYMENLAQTFALIFLLCYFASASYDYRLVFLFIPALYIVNSQELDNRTRLFLVVTLIMTVWFSYASSYLQILGDIAILPWVVLLTQSALSSLSKGVKKLVGSVSV